MADDLAAYRARIGRFNAAKFATPCIGNKCKCGQLVFFFGLVCSILLVISGVETNPGPEHNEITLKDIWDKLHCLENIQKDVAQVKDSIATWSKEIGELRADVNHASAECEWLRQENENLRKKVDQLENQSRRSNLVFYNVQEGPRNETWQETEDVVIDIIKNEMKVKLEAYDIERAHRVGKMNKEKDRPIIVKFNNYKKKTEVLSAKNNLSGLRIGLAEDFSEAVRNKRRDLKDYMFAAKKKGHKAELRFDKLMVNGRYYTLEQLQSSEAPTTHRPTPASDRQRPTIQQQELGEEGATDTQDDAAAARGEDGGGEGRTARTQGDLLDWLGSGRVTRSRATKARFQRRD